MPASRASSNAWRTPDAAVSVIGSIVEPRHTIIHSDLRIDNGDRYQLFVFILRRPIRRVFFVRLSIVSDRSFRNPVVVNGNSRNLRGMAIEVLCKNTRFKREFRAAAAPARTRTAG